MQDYIEYEQVREVEEKIANLSYPYIGIWKDTWALWELDHKPPPNLYEPGVNAIIVFFLVGFAVEILGEITGVRTTRSLFNGSLLGLICGVIAYYVSKNRNQNYSKTRNTALIHQFRLFENTHLKRPAESPTETP